MRTEIAIISALALVLSVPVAFGEIVETKGQNYDLVENFFIGEAVWESHPERIMDGGWQNYALSNTGDKVIFNTNAVGSFVFDKNSCSYSIYGNGFDGEQVIPSVSAVATYLNNGQWQNLPINDKACTVTVDRYEDGVFLKSTKVITEDITEDVFIPYTGTTQNFYSNSTNSQFTLVTNSTGNVGYFNGETITTTGIEVEKFVQEIDLNIHKGFKETFKVWHDGSEELGISQTIHSGESITIGETVIDIAQLNGQSFDRQYIIDNEAEILAITDSVNYDFDTGIESLSNINIIFDGDYKVNMDYADGGFVGYLEIDPTLVLSTTNYRYYYEDDGDSTCDDSATGAGQGTMGNNMNFGLSKSNGEDCYRGAVEFDISAINDGSTITNVSLDLDIDEFKNNGATSACDIRSLTAVRPTVDSAGDMFTGIDDGTLLVNDNFCNTTGGSLGINTIDLGSVAVSELENQLSSDWFVLGFHQDNDSGSGLNSNPYYVAILNDPELTVTYSVPIAPQPPTNLSTVTGIPIELDWDSPVTTTTVSPILNDDFSTDGFTHTDSSKTSVSSGEFNWEIELDNSDDTAYIQLSETLGEQFVLRFDYTTDSITTTGNPGGFGKFVLSDSANGQSSSFDFIGFERYLSDASNSWGLRYGDNTSGNSDSDNFTTVPTGTSTYYMEIIRDGSTITGNQYTSSDFTGTPETTTLTISGTVDGLEYFKFYNRADNSNTGQTGIGSIDNLKVYNGVTDTDTQISTGDGGSAITGYKVYRTLNEFAVTELPNNSANANGVDFTDNEFLLNGFETTTLASAIETHRDSNTWLSLGFKLADETLNGNNRYVDVSPTEESGTDPTLTIVADGTTYTLVATEDLAPRGNQNTGCVNPSSGSILDSSAEWFAVTAYPSGSTYNKCVRGMAEFDISSIPTSATITDATMTWKVDANGLDSTDRIAIYVMDTQGTTLTSFTGLYQGITSGTLVSDTVNITGTGEKTFSVYDGSVATTLPDKSTNSISISTSDTETQKDMTQWTLSGFSSSGNSVQKTSGTGWNSNEYAKSVEEVTVGDKMIVLEFDGGNTGGAMFGFNYGSPTGHTSGNPNDFGFYLASVYGEVYENGSQASTSSGTPSLTDRHKITIDVDGTVKYYINNVEVHESTNTASGTYYVNSHAYGQGNTVSNIELYYLEINPTASTTGVISTGVQSPDLSFTDSNLFDSTDDFSIGSWVKLDSIPATTPSISVSDFSSYSVNGGSSKFTTSSNGYTFTEDTSSIQSRLYNDLGTSNISDQFTLRVPFEVTSFTGHTTSGNNHKQEIGISAGFGLGEDPTDDGVLVRYVQQQGSNELRFSILARDGSTKTLSQAVAIPYTSVSTPVTYYLELSRNVNSHTLNVFDDSAYSNSLGTATVTQSGITGLQYYSHYLFTQSSNGVTSGSVDNFRFYDGISSGVTDGVPPANTKLLQLNDVTFNVGTDSASVVKSTPVIQSQGSTGAWEYVFNTGQIVSGGTWSVDFMGQKFPTGHTLVGKLITEIEFDLSYNTSTGVTPNEVLQLVKLDSSNTLTVLEDIPFSSLSTSGSGSGNSPNFTTETFNSFTPFTLQAGDKLGIYVSGTLGGSSSDANCSGTCTYVEIAHTQGESPEDVVSGENRYGQANNGSNFTTANTDMLGDVKYTISYGGTIISATGLTDNTSSPQHYSFVRDGNDWEIYQNGVSEATATDSISLGTYTAGTSLAWNANGVKGSQNVGSSGGHVYPTAGGWNEARAKTVGSITAGQEMSFTIDTSAQGFGGGAGYWGIDSSDTITSGSDSDIDYSFYVDGGATSLYMYKDGTSIGTSSTYAKGDTLSISIDSSGNVSFKKNGSQIGTSTGATASNYYGHYLSLLSGSAGFGGTVSYPTTPATVWTTNIDGMIDEYFIDSTALTSTEIDQVYENGKPLTPIATTNAVTTEYDDNTVVGGNDYYYSVKATNAIGDSDFLTPFVSGLAGTPADPPSSVSSTINSPNTAPLDITVSWSSPTNVGSGTLTGFEIYRDSVLIDTTGLVTSYTDTVPSGGGTFEYKLKSLSTHGTSGFSGTTSTTTPTVPPTPTATPTLAIDNPNPSPLDIDVSWSAQSSGGSAITGYEIFRSADDITFTSVGTVTDLDFTDTVPSAGTWYYTFASTNLVGSSGQSPSNSITTATVPSSPLNASSVIPSVNSAPYDVTVSWELPTSTGGSDLTGYNVYRQTGSGVFTLVTTTTALGYIDTVPTALNQDYTFKIHSLNNVGESTGFVTTTITTGDVPDAPVLSITTGTTALSWTVPSSDASITGYKIFRDSVLLTTVTTTSHSDFTTIVFGNSYDYKIVAVSSLGDSADSNTVTTTPETEITGMIAQGVTGTGAVIDWDEPAYYQGQITNYEVYYSEITASVTTPATSAGTTTNTYSNFAPNLDYDTTYIFGVKINSPLGNSGFSNYVTVTTSVDNSIVAFDPTTGGMEWFDIDSVNEQTVNVIEFQRETQDDVVNGTTIVFDTLQVAYPSWWDDMTCDVDYKFAQKTEQYIEGEDMTSLVNPSDANQQIIGFQFHDIDNEVIEVECAPQQSTQDDGVSAKYVMTQNSFGTLQADGTYSNGLPNIPLVTQVTNFTSGEYGTDGDFGAIDIVGLFVILVSMVGFNRVSPIVGVLISASTIFALSFFGLIAIPTIIVGAIALVIFLAWGIHRKR